MDPIGGRRSAHLGAPGGRLASCPGTPNCVSSQAAATDATHDVAPLAFTIDPRLAWDTLPEVVATAGRASIVTERENHLHAEFRSRLIGFVDDLECVLDAGV